MFCSYMPAGTVLSRKPVVTLATVVFKYRKLDWLERKYKCILAWVKIMLLFLLMMTQQILRINTQWTMTWYSPTNSPAESQVGDISTHSSDRKQQTVTEDEEEHVQSEVNQSCHITP